jgi:capsular exopolysaccharide synthesis family protein
MPSLPPPPALSATPDVWSLLRALRRRWASAVLIGGTLASISAVAMWFLLTPKASAFAKLQVAYSQENVWPGGPPPQHDFKTYMGTIAAAIISRPVIWAALKRDEVKALALESREADPMQMIEDNLTVEFKENSELLTIVFKHSDPNVAKVVANAIKEAYYDNFVVAEQDKHSKRITALDRALGDANSAVALKRNDLKRIVQDQGIVDPALWQSRHLEAIQNLREMRQQQTNVQIKLADARREQEVFEARVKAMEGRGGRTGPDDRLSADEIREAIESAVDGDAQAKRLRELLDDLELQLQDYRERFHDNYISVRLTRDRVARVRKQFNKRRDVVAARVRKMAARPRPAATPGSPTPMGTSPEEIKVMRAQLDRQVNALASVEKKLDREISTLSTLAAKAPAELDNYNRIVEEIKRVEKTIADVTANKDREEVEYRVASRITKYQDAELMKTDIKKQLLATLVVPIAVLCSVCGGLALLEHRQRKVRSAGEISRGLGIRVVGAVPRMHGLERRLVGPAGDSELEGTPVMESIDAIRTRLLHEADVRATRVVMVTSATAGEGKTTLASALASSLARAGRKTLLLDGDLRRPTVHELFEVPMQPGLSEVLLGEIEVAEAAVESPQENLYLLPAGQWDREVLLALSRDGLEGIVEKLAEEFDFIVVDSHPVLAATDALLIGRQADAVVLSVLHEVSQMPRVYAAHQQLTALGIRVLGAVVNGSDPEEVFTSPAPAIAA